MNIASGKDLKPTCHLTGWWIPARSWLMSSIYSCGSGGVIGPFSLQSEFIYSTLDTEFMGDADLYGWYVFASYFLTGESRPYKTSNGTFDRIRPNQNFLDDGGMGAWKLRYAIQAWIWTM